MEATATILVRIALKNGMLSIDRLLFVFVRWYMADRMVSRALQNSHIEVPLGAEMLRLLLELWLSRRWEDLALSSSGYFDAMEVMSSRPCA